MSAQHRDTFARFQRLVKEALCGPNFVDLSGRDKDSDFGKPVNASSRAERFFS
jgi:hypothetical protein